MKGTMNLRQFLNFEGTLNRKGTMALRTLLISKGQKKRRWGEERLVNTSQEREERERVFNNSMKLYDVSFELSEVLYLYRNFVTVLAKIVTAITLMDKIKMKFIH